jgi:hypothetical protein
MAPCCLDYYNTTTIRKERALVEAAVFPLVAFRGETLFATAAAVDVLATFLGEPFGPDCLLLVDDDGFFSSASSFSPLSEDSSWLGWSRFLFLMLDARPRLYV